MPGSKENTIPVKPITEFSHQFSEFLKNLKNNKKTKFSIAIVGGGAGGLELAFATQYRLFREFGDKKEIQISLVTNKEILSNNSSPNYIRSQFRKILKKKKIEVYENSPVLSVSKNELNLKNGKIAFDQCLWCTDAQAANWLKNTQLKTGLILILLLNSKLN